MTFRAIPRHLPAPYDAKAAEAHKALTTCNKTAAGFVFHVTASWGMDEMQEEQP